MLCEQNNKNNVNLIGFDGILCRESIKRKLCENLKIENCDFKRNELPCETGNCFHSECIVYL